MIQVENLTKAFGSKLAVNGISFSVTRGEVLGFLGPNGAGKSTTMRMITGFVPPSDGKVSVGGYDLSTEPLAAKRLIGYLPENAPLYVDMTVRSFLGFCADLSGLRGDDRKRAVHRVVELCFLEPVFYQSVDTLSKGYRHRTCLAQAILHDPDVLVLDEPTDGLDPNQKHEIRGLIRRMGQRKAIIFSTHILEEVEAVCSRAIIIDRGQIVANETPAELKQRSQNAGAVRVRFTDGIVNVIERLSQLPLAARVDRLNGSSSLLRVMAKEKTAAPELSRAIGELAARERWTIEELLVEEGRLD